MRTGALGGAFVLLGLLPTLLGGPVWSRAAGHVPGFGIVYATPTPGWSVELVPWVLLHLVVLLAVVAGLLTGVQRVMAKGDHLTLPAVVAASMLLAAVLAAVHDGHGHAPQEWVPVAEVLAVVGVPAALLVRERRRERSARRVGDARQARLDVVAREEWRPGPDERADEDDRARLARWAETLALQPAHEWNGFGRFGDEYLLPAMRYRVWAVFLMLASLRHTHTPAYCGYRDDALRALVLRMTDKPVWRYWLRENRWGMLRDSADPIGSPANVMYSGYLLLMLSAYRQATGDESFDRPGALRFRWDDRTETAYSHTDVAERVSANFQRSPLVLWPCEPGLVFPFCNSVALAGLRMYDTCAGTRHAEAIAPRFLHRLRTEFTAPDGDICTLQASRFASRPVPLGASPTPRPSQRCCRRSTRTSPGAPGNCSSPKSSTPATTREPTEPEARHRPTRTGAGARTARTPWAGACSSPALAARPGTAGCATPRGTWRTRPRTSGCSTRRCTPTGSSAWARSPTNAPGGTCCSPRPATPAPASPKRPGRTSRSSPRPPTAGPTTRSSAAPRGLRAVTGWASTS
ncbi:linalool dehydratase/isomerase domain-containing protein [Saccharopolyspora karakumensis]|uniref:linalool dehydratase/isomerase domain-containing protein n=1 Tax=Saccharopolyspora karakumensis TaxID=2530386 RepID=UPI001F41D7DB|nr:hypothetical protein [Saccharopolyspora karakumensis]